MSWWNTSNFSDLASKALKNAQKKIDSALDINEGGTQKHDTTGASVEKETKSKTDFWGAWGGSSTTEDNTGAAGAWSFPWGASTGEPVQETSSESLIKVKSAEEIKSEVLKAAKERTKAKAKLFPKKGKTVIEKEKVLTEPVSDNKASAGVKLKDDKPPDSGGDEVAKGKEPKIDTFDSQSVKDTEPLKGFEDSAQHITEHENIGDSIEGTSEHKKDTVPKVEAFEADTETAVHESFISDSINEDIKGEDQVRSSGLQENVKIESEISEKEEPEIQTDMSDEKNYVSNVDIEEKETDVFKQEMDIITESEVIPTTETSVKDDTVTVKESVADIFEESGEKTENAPELTALEDDNSVKEASDVYLSRDLSSGDISSSVEFVSEKDIPVAENVTVGDGEQSNSDPEIIDCDKTTFDEEFVTEKVSSDVYVDETTVKQEQSVTENVFLNKEDTKAETIVNETSQEADAFPEANEPEDNTHVTGKDKLVVESENVSNDGARPEDFANISCEESLLMILPDSVIPGAVKSLRSSDSESSVNKLDSSMETCTSEDTIIESSSAQDDSNDKSGLALIKAEPNINFESTEDIEETSETVVEKSTELLDVQNDSEENDMEKGTISPAHSFVKCMLEDAIEDGKHGDSDSHSSLEKSEGSRSVYSNQESGDDEIDTTTSSDIEIISMPTPNGENRQVSPLDPIPLRIALQKTSWKGSPTHRRTDSSDSSNASGGNIELSPGRDCSDYTDYHRSHSEHMEGHSQAPELPALSEEDDNPYHPQRLLKKLAEMAEVLQAREEKLLTQSKENCDLMETNSILRNQLKQSEEAREAEMTDVNELTTEFTQRLTDAELRISSAIKEKEVIKKQLQDTQAELAKRAGDVSLKEILAEKEEQIAGLLQEGEKLSKSQLQSNTIIKKLRQKEKDNESTLTSQKKKIETQTTELEHLHKVLESKEDLEKKQTEAIAQLTSAVKKQEQEMVKLKSEHEDAVEKARGLQVALDNSYKEMAELHRNSAALDSKASEAALSAEMQVREELKRELEKQQQQHKWAVESLNMQIEDHRLSMARMEKEYNRREDLLKQEIADLQKQLQEDEARNQELTQGVSLATRPLLRQIENLQSTYNAQSSTWEKVERNMSERLADTQNQLAIAMEKERTANEQVMELGSKVTSLETQNSRLKQERSQLSAQLEMLKAKVELSEDAKQNEAAQIEVLKQQMGQELQDMKKQKLLLETQLDVEKSKMEQEKKKTAMLQDQIRDLERDLARSMSRSRGTPVRATPSPVSVSRQDSLVGSVHDHSFSAITQEELDRSFVLSTPNGNKQSLYEALRQSGAANLLENLQSQLKLREGEISHLQNEIRTLERTRESMARELVDLSNKNDNMEEKLKDLPLLEEQYKDLDQRYNALLQMYGEKTEEAEELKLDLVDVKDMYKAQINHLLGQS